MQKNLYDRIGNNPFSPAEIFLAGRLRSLKMEKVTKDEVITIMTKSIDGICFTKAEAVRIWNALQSVTFFHDGHEMTAIEKGKLIIPRVYRVNNSNFFENYAKDLIEQGDIQKHCGGIKGVCSEAKRLAMKKAREAKKKLTMASLVHDEGTSEFYGPEVKQEESPKLPMFGVDGKIDFSSYKDEDLASIAVAFQKAVEEEQAARAHRTHVQKVLAVIKEMVASEGLNWEEILTADEILWSYHLESPAGMSGRTFRRISPSASRVRSNSGTSHMDC